MDNKEKVSNNIFFISLTYSIVGSILIYKNINGITLPFFALGSILYILYYMSHIKTMIKKDNYIIMFFIILISISSFLTNYLLIVYLNFAIMNILFLIILIHNFVNDEQFDIFNYLSAIRTTIFYPIFHIRPILNYNENKYDNSDTINKPIDVKQINTLGTSEAKNIIYGIMISMALLFIIVPILKSSDIVFSNLIDNILKNIDYRDIINFILLVIILLLISFVGMKYLYIYKDTNYQYNNKKSGSTTTVLISLIPITMIYIVYSYIQITHLFINANVNYANFAREGFFQLLFVSFINLLLIILFLHKVSNNNITKLLFTIISATTLIMTFSSAYRMCLYVKYYDLSHLRYFVFFALILITFIMFGIIISLYYEKFNLPKYFIFTFMFFYTIFAFSRPCEVIAKYNFSHKILSTRDNTSFDYRYLIHYSSDASKTIYEYYTKNKEYITENKELDYYFKLYFYRIETKYSILDFNLSKFQGKKYYDLYSTLKDKP